MDKPDMEASWRPLCWHMQASAAGVANAHVIVFASTQTLFHDEEIMNSLVYNIGQFAGKVDQTQILKKPVGIANLHRFITENFSK